MSLLQTAIFIKRFEGEEALREWADKLSADDKKQLVEELTPTVERLTEVFRSMQDVFKQAAIQISKSLPAFRALYDYSQLEQRKLRRRLKYQRRYARIGREMKRK
jgi:hypothetical protein